MCLSGGGARGFAYLGAFKAFEEYKTIETLVSNINPAEEKDKTFDEKVRDFETSFLNYDDENVKSMKTNKKKGIKNEQFVFNLY